MLNSFYKTYQVYKPVITKNEYFEDIEEFVEYKKIQGAVSSLNFQPYESNSVGIHKIECIMFTQDTDIAAGMKVEDWYVWCVEQGLRETIVRLVYADGK